MHSVLLVFCGGMANIRVALLPSADAIDCGSVAAAANHQLMSPLRLAVGTEVDSVAAMQDDSGGRCRRRSTKLAGMVCFEEEVDDSPRSHAIEENQDHHGAAGPPRGHTAVQKKPLSPSTVQKVLNQNRSRQGQLRPPERPQWSILGACALALSACLRHAAFPSWSCSAVALLVS
jgi:hypothetical protein